MKINLTLRNRNLRIFVCNVKILLVFNVTFLTHQKPSSPTVPPTAIPTRRPARATHLPAPVPPKKPNRRPLRAPRSPAAAIHNGTTRARASTVAQTAPKRNPRTKKKSGKRVTTGSTTMTAPPNRTMQTAKSLHRASVSGRNGSLPKRLARASSVRRTRASRATTTSGGRRRDALLLPLLAIKRAARRKQTPKTS